MDLQRILKVLLIKSVLAIEVINHDNGWKPIPNEVALFQAIASPRTFENGIVPTNLKNDAIQLVDPRRLDQLVSDRKPKTLRFEHENFDEAGIKGLCSECEKNRLKYVLSSTSQELKQTAKEKGIHNDLAKFTTDEAEKTSKAELHDSSYKEYQQNSVLYDVTEKPEDPKEILTSQNYPKERYAYKMPEKPLFMATSENLSSKFLDILAKYNLNSKVSDVNYALSRTHKNNEFRNIFVTLPLRVPSRYYDNPNHISKDAILAMILSNYGLYLPGMFGYSGQYKNLLEYLASNNINNNKSFGLYKTFSDTDSSH